MFELLLYRQVNALGSYVAHLGHVLLGKGVLNSKGPGFRIRELLVRNVRGGLQARRRRIGDWDQLRRQTTIGQECSLADWHTWLVTSQVCDNCGGSERMPRCHKAHR